MSNLIYLLQEKEVLESRLEKIYYGSIEIRDNAGKKNIYVHRRENGLQVTKYVGQYSEDLANLILSNNILVKDLKKRLKAINKELKKIDYRNEEINDLVKLNIDIARRNLVDSIYKQAMLEGVATTYSDTETIVNGGKVKNMTATDISKIVNLKHAWEFILNEKVISYPTNYAILSQINALVEEGLSYSAGKIRSVPVSIGGSFYIPPLPFEDKVKEELNIILNSKKESIDIAIELTLFVMKAQIYLDGNKRTAIIFANHYLISKGGGIIVIPAELVSDYKKHLINYYEDESSEIISFLKEKCWIKIK